MAKTIICNTRFGRLITPPESTIRSTVLNREMSLHKLISSEDLEEIQILKICNNIIADLEWFALENLLHNPHPLPKFQEGYDQVTSLVKEAMQTYDLPGWEGL